MLFSTPMPTQREIRFLVRGAVSALLATLAAVVLTYACRPEPEPPAPPPGPAPIPIDQPVRPEPEKFPRNSHLPKGRELDVCGKIDLSTFSPGRDLVYVDDARVWWESDHDGTVDTECDHSVHRRVKEPLRRLIELVSQRGGTLEIHDAFRSTGIHNIGSLHREGRALDVTCDQMSMEDLAKLCWAAGFEWVLHEASPRSGPHVHCSMSR
jgi:hypothetical protein